MLGILTSRRLFLLASLSCWLLLAFGYYLQYAKHIEPCSLCILQRYSFIAIGLMFGLLAWHNPKRVGLYFYSIFIAIISLIGAALAGRQLWLQQQPAELNTVCLPNMVFNENSHWNDLLGVSTSCNEVAWTLWGLSIANWSLLFFVGFTVFILITVLFHFIFHRRMNNN